jgi:hypothetical protein
MQSFLYYWRPQTADYEIGRKSKLDHSASEQFGRVHPDDHVWHVTVRDGKLSLLGRLIVGAVVDQRTAARRLDTDDLWPASYHLLASNGTAQFVREVAIPRLSGLLRFESARDRLSLDGGLVNVHQLRTMRKLTPASASKLEVALSRTQAAGRPS